MANPLAVAMSRAALPNRCSRVSSGASNSSPNTVAEMKFKRKSVPIVGKTEYWSTEYS